jgi:uncharacterized protein (DUF1800 family)
VTLPDLEELGDTFQAYRRRQRAGDLQGSSEMRRMAQISATEATAALNRRIATERPFAERWVAFWSNHLCVSRGRAFAVRLLAGHYERSVIRPHVFGRFDEMVLASARHPAMLIYLDNVRSIGPDSRAVQMRRRAAAGGSMGRRGRARRAGSRRPPQQPPDAPEEPGLNENYARELLELHTLGVDGGYTQRDVTELARLLTGWTVAGLNPEQQRRIPGMPDRFGFAFVPLLHDTGRKTVLGRRYGEGEDDGERAIRDLCAHPATARFIAGKLVRHFVADDPPAEAVDTVARAFGESEGDLRHVARTVINLDAAWAPEHAKFRTPQDWLVAAVRGIGGREAHPAFLPVLQQLRHPLWAPPAPRGYGDTTREWADPDALMNRAELARTVARRVVGDARRPPDPRVLSTIVDLQPGDPLGPLLGDDAVAVDERVALALAGPTFQWR